jgi:hypothetical protein
VIVLHARYRFAPPHPQNRPLWSSATLPGCPGRPLLPWQPPGRVKTAQSARETEAVCYFPPRKLQLAPAKGKARADVTARERTTHTKGFTPAAATSHVGASGWLAVLAQHLRRQPKVRKLRFRPPRRRESTGAVVRTGSEWATRTVGRPNAASIG